jgi:hypothetical protein
MVALTAELTRLMNNARIQVPGALDAALQLELFNVLDDFLQRSNFWQEDITYTANPTRTSYELSGTEAGVIVSLLGNVNSAAIGVPASMTVPGTLDLVNAPPRIDIYTATVSYTVVDPVDSNIYPQFPDGLLQKYGVGVLHGVVGRMMAQPSKPYTNERMSIFNTRKFDVAVAQARAAVRHKNINGGQAWRFPSFAGGSRR